MKNKLRNWKIYLRIFILMIMLYILHKFGLPIYFIFLFGIIILLLIFLRGTIYKKLDHFFISKIPFLSRLKPDTRKIIIIIVFILFYILLKQIIFFILKLFGIDVQQMIFESINNSINQS
jgi:hypothetical protein